MAGMVQISGMNRVLAGLKASKLATAAGAERGLKQGGLFLQRVSQKIVPVDKDILKPSADTRNVGGKGFDADIVVSFSTEYAVYVHEDLQAKHKTGKQAKYLEEPARTKRGEIIRIIREEAKL